MSLCQTKLILYQHLTHPPTIPTYPPPYLQDDELDVIMSDSAHPLPASSYHAHHSQSLRSRDKMLGRLLFRFINSPAAQMALVSAFGIAHR